MLTYVFGGDNGNRFLTSKQWNYNAAKIKMKCKSAECYTSSQCHGIIYIHNKKHALHLSCHVKEGTFGRQY